MGNQFGGNDEEATDSANEAATEMAEGTTSD
jgi:hypothetical protein